MCGNGCSDTEQCRYDKANCEYKCTVYIQNTEAPTTTASQESIIYNIYILATASQEIISINLIILLFNNLI